MTVALVAPIEVRHVTEGVTDYNRFMSAFRRRLRGRLYVFGKRTAALMKRTMKSWSGENSLPWAEAKGQEGSPLYHTGFAQSHMKHRTYPGGGDVIAVCEVGAIKNAAYPTRPLADAIASSGRDLHGVLDIINRGASWTPGSKERQAFWAKVPKADSQISEVKPSDTYTIPERNFLQKVSLSPVVLKWLHDYVGQASKGALRDIGAK
jgi:hypothetical protein